MGTIFNNKTQRIRTLKDRCSNYILSIFSEKKQTFSVKDIETIAPALFIIKKRSNKYLVNTEIGICSCPAGASVNISFF